MTPSLLLLVFFDALLPCILSNLTPTCFTLLQFKIKYTILKKQRCPTVWYHDLLPCNLRLSTLHWDHPQRNRRLSYPLRMQAADDMGYIRIAHSSAYTRAQKFKTTWIKVEFCRKIIKLAPMLYRISLLCSMNIK